MFKDEISRREFIGRTVGGAAAASLALGAQRLAARRPPMRRSRWV